TALAGQLHQRDDRAFGRHVEHVADDWLALRTGNVVNGKWGRGGFLDTWGGGYSVCLSDACLSDAGGSVTRPARMKTTRATITTQVGRRSTTAGCSVTLTSNKIASR